VVDMLRYLSICRYEKQPGVAARTLTQNK
jgi:hypothetical protein